jgi:hypothetical protein
VFLSLSLETPIRFDGIENASNRGEFQRPVEALALGSQGTRMDPDFPRMDTDRAIIE